MKAEIDLDWLEAEIENAETKIKVFKDGHVLKYIQEAICGKLHEVRSKCNTIEESPTTKIDPR